MTNEDRRAEIQKYHCVTQLQRDSWEYRVKQASDEPNCDDLVSWDDYLALHDRLVLERDALDKKRIAEIEELRRQCYERGEELSRLSREQENDWQIWQRRIDDAEAERDAYKRNATLAIQRKLEAAESQLSSLSSERDESNRWWAAASEFIRDVIEAVGRPQPEPKGIVNLPELALQVVGQIEDYKSQLSSLSRRQEGMREALLKLRMDLVDVANDDTELWLKLDAQIEAALSPTPEGQQA